jgi:hypothetical protein
MSFNVVHVACRSNPLKLVNFTTKVEERWGLWSKEQQIKREIPVPADIFCFPPNDSSETKEKLTNMT